MRRISGPLAIIPITFTAISMDAASLPGVTHGSILNETNNEEIRDMTPIQIEIMLHYNSRTNDYGQADDNFDAPAVQQTISWFIEADLLEPNPVASPEEDGPKYRITKKGLAYIDGLRNLPLPVCEWRIPAVA